MQIKLCFNLPISPSFSSSSASKNPYPCVDFPFKDFERMFQVLERTFQVFECTFQVLERKIPRGAGEKTPCREEFFCPFSEKILRCPIFPSLWFSIPIGFGLPGGVHHHGHTAGTALPQVTYNIIMYRQTKLKTEVNMNRIINILSTSCLVQAKAIGADAEGRQAYGSFAFLSAGSKQKGCPGLPQ